MLNAELLNKIQDQFDSTDENVISVGYGKKHKNGKPTGEIGIIYGVKEKKPIGEIPSDKLLPKSLTVDGKTYVTDVNQTEEMRLVPGCWDAGTDLNNDGTPDTNPDPVNVAPHRARTRPIQGGVIITNFVEGFSVNAQNNIALGIGTLGLICVDLDTNTLVGLTNSHVVVRDAFIASERTSPSIATNLTQSLLATQNGVQKIIPNSVAQFDDTNHDLEDFYPNNIKTDSIIGKVKKYYPLRSTTTNFIDCAVMTLNSSVISPLISFKQLGQSPNYFMDFATTEEINNLITNDNNIYSSGRTTGRKGESCQMEVTQLGASFNIIYKKETVNTQILFQDCFYIRYRNLSLSPTIISGDSGSCVTADINGQRKIIGLVFAGNSTEGAVCRIDRIASILNLKAWKGEDYSVDGPSNAYIHQGLSDDIFKNINGQKYWQVGKQAPGSTSSSSAGGQSNCCSASCTQCPVNGSIYINCNGDLNVLGQNAQGCVVYTCC